jgi:hypothetical protein
MQILMVMLNNLQPYILDNLQNLKNHNNDDVVIITDKKFNNYFDKYQVNIINVEDLILDYNKLICNLNNTFRGGFWKLTSYRFNVIYEYMNKYNVQNIIHIENDVLIYKNANSIRFHNMNKLLLTMDSKNRCIPGIMFIPNHTILKKCLDLFNPSLNDMQNFSNCYYRLSEQIDSLPIFLEDSTNDVSNIITKNFKYYNCIFDAAAIGQYLGGVDPKNKSGDTTGFVNETCVIDYSKYKFIWKNENDKKNPYIVVNNNEYPIVNLHIHCKDLKKFI